MATLPNWFRQPILIALTVVMLVAQAIRGSSRMAPAAERLFLKQQIALYEEPKGY